MLAARGVAFDRAVILINIEGGEFDVLTDNCLHELRHANLIVEIHGFLGEG